jgi:hypothetical protein
MTYYVIYQLKDKHNGKSEQIAERLTFHSVSLSEQQTWLPSKYRLQALPALPEILCME